MSLGIEGWVLADCLHSDYGVAFYQQLCHLGLEMHLASTTEDGVAHVFYHSRQLVRADMRMGIGKDVCRSTVLTEYVKNLFDVATLLAAGVELAVGIGSCPTLTEAVVTLAIYLLRLRDLGKVFISLIHILSKLQYNGTIAKFNEFEGGKESAGSRTDDYHLRTT